MADTTTKALKNLVEKLQAERQSHVDAIAEIDGTFESLGIDVATPAKKRGPGRPRKSKVTTGAKAHGRKRRSFKQTAEELVLSLVGGKTKLTTADINKAWKKAGRKGSADNTLSLMVKNGKLKRENIPGKRGSTYAAA